MNTNPGVYGKKVGFTQIYNEKGEVLRASVVETSDLVVVGKRSLEKNGYVALIVGLQDAKEKHLNRAQKVAFEKAEVKAKRIVKEIRCDEAFASKFEVGQNIPLDQVFEAGQKVDVRGKTRGRGFTGVMRRWNFAGFRRTHGTHEYQRHGGSIGTNMTPGRTLPNLKMPGQYGDETVSVQNLKVVKVDPEKHLLFVAGGLPGAKNGLVLVRVAVKQKKRKIGRV